jgi:hypothetical protein
MEVGKVSKKKRTHHSKPHGGGVSFAQRLAQQRMLQQALTDEVAIKQANLWAKQDTQRALWLMVIAVAEAFHIGPMRLSRDFFPVLDNLNQELQQMREENGDVYAFEKLKQRAEQVSGMEIRHFYDPDPAAALKEEEGKA